MHSRQGYFGPGCEQTQRWRCDFLSISSTGSGAQSGLSVPSAKCQAIGDFQGLERGAVRLVALKEHSERGEGKTSF